MKLVLHLGYDMHVKILSYSVTRAFMFRMIINTSNNEKCNEIDANVKTMYSIESETKTVNIIREDNWLEFKNVFVTIFGFNSSIINHK